MKLLSFFLIVFLSGCSALNSFYDENRNFENTRNSEVGKLIGNVLKSERYYDYWEGNKHYFNHKKYILFPVGNNYSEYQFESGSCKWSLKVENSTERVVSWSYLSDGSSCKYKRFFEGSF